jgi:hypothetical protein
VTDPGAIVPWPGAKPVGLPGQAPPATLEGIAFEVGKIEKKLEQAFTNPSPTGGLNWDEWWDAISKLYGLLISLTDAGQYTLSSPCVPADEPGGVNNPLVRAWDGSLTPAGGLEKRLDALAGLVQDHKNLKQPICRERPTITGELVTVNFRSVEKSPQGKSQLRKYLRYRDQTGSHRDVHTAHWENFEWDAGPVLVASKGAEWGIVSCWAATEAEGKRVIGHAAQVAGVDLTRPAHSFVVSGSKDPRYGQTGRMRVDRRDDHWIRVSKRPGPDGLPVLSGPMLGP